MSENKTKATTASVDAFIDSIPNEKKRNDSKVILQMMYEVTGEKPKMWGGSIIGFGDIHYKYASGREGDWFKIGFSPRKQNISLYLSQVYMSDNEELKKLGKHKTGKSCLYINKLEDVDKEVLRKMMEESLKNPSF